MTTPPPRPARATTDIPVTRQVRPGPDLAALAQRWALPIRSGYLLCIAFATLMQLEADPSLANALQRLADAFAPHINYKDVVDAARNVALFVGWGAVWILTDRAPSMWRSVGRATVVGLLASATVEGIQAFSTVRTASILDVATNALGAFLGAAIVWAMEHRAATDMRRGTLLGMPAWMPAGAWLAATFGLAWAPTSRPVLFLGWSPTPWDRLQASVARSPEVPALQLATVPDAIVFGLAGLLAALAVCDRAGRLRLPQLVAWAALGVVAAAAAQLGRGLSGVTIEPAVLWVQLPAYLGMLAIGCTVMPRWRAAVPARSTRALQVGLAITFIGALAAWWPASWIPATDRSVITLRQLIPMYSLVQRQDLATVFLVLTKGALGAALGSAVAARKAVGQPVPGFRAVALVALAWELGQLLVPGRYPDITDVLITGAAGGLMAVLGGRAKQGATTGGG